MGSGTKGPVTPAVTGSTAIHLRRKALAWAGATIVLGGAAFAIGQVATAPAKERPAGSMSRQEVNNAIDQIADKILSLPTPKEPALTPVFSKTFTFGLKDDRELTTLKLRIGYSILKNLEFKQGEKLLNARLRSDAIVKAELEDYGIKNPKAGTVQALEAYAWGMTTALFIGDEIQANGNQKPFAYDPKTLVNGYIHISANSMLYAQQMLDHKAPYGACGNVGYFVRGGLGVEGNFSNYETTDHIRRLAPNSRIDNHGYASIPLSPSGEAMPTWDSSKGGTAESKEGDKKLWSKDSVKWIPFWIDASWVNVPNEVRFTLPQDRNDRELLALVAGAMDDILPHNEKLIKLFWSPRVADGPYYEGNFRYPYASSRESVMSTDLRASKPIFDALEDIWSQIKER